jgi:hypothetical protein
MFEYRVIGWWYWVTKFGLSAVIVSRWAIA